MSDPEQNQDTTNTECQPSGRRDDATGLGKEVRKWGTMLTLFGVGFSIFNTQLGNDLDDFVYLKVAIILGGLLYIAGWIMIIVARRGGNDKQDLGESERK